MINFSDVPLADIFSQISKKTNKGIIRKLMIWWSTNLTVLKTYRRLPKK